MFIDKSCLDLESHSNINNTLTIEVFVLLVNKVRHIRIQLKVSLPNY
jgi:hypothetical protein